ncbi:unnamed protein product [Musa hybrid cultivar]
MILIVICRFIFIHTDLITRALSIPLPLPQLLWSSSMSEGPPFCELKEAERMEPLGIVSEAQELSQSLADRSATMIDSNPPFFAAYGSLFRSRPAAGNHEAEAVEECDLPIVDLSRLSDELQVEQCKREIVTAASAWGFFQIVNHGIPNGVLDRLRAEQVRAFRQPFKKKADEKFLGFLGDSYRWGAPTATSLKQLSWLEAYHIPLSSATHPATTSTCRCVIEELSSAMSRLADRLMGILAEGLGSDGSYIKDNCKRNTCYLRLNRYPPCPVAGEVFGLVPHTDTDFLTVLCQDNVIGLQLKKGGRWIAVRPNPGTLIINVGDLFQAWSNGLYKSVEHRVMSNPHLERFSVAYFVCPSKETLIESSARPAIYRKFSFGEYRQQVQQDVTLLGYKVGLTRFLASCRRNKHTNAHLKKLQILDLSHCKKLRKLPAQIHKLENLKILRLAYCTQLERLVNLLVLEIEGRRRLQSLHDSFSDMENLTELKMLRCDSLTGMPRGIGKPV